MSKYQYSESERQINAVLAHQQSDLDKLESLDRESLDARIAESEALLRDLGITPTAELKTNRLANADIRTIALPTWEDLSEKALREHGSDVALESLFTQEELAANEAAVLAMNEDFNVLHRLDEFDIAISASASLLAAAVEMLLIGIPKHTTEGLSAAPLSDYIRDRFEQKYPAGMLENSPGTKVPYDAQDNRATLVTVEGLSSYYHRLLSLGHDPLLGMVVGVLDILTGNMTTIDKSGKIARQALSQYAGRREADLFAAIVKQIAHYKSDVTTSMGLPAPMMGLFNLLQFGSIGKEEQTIAEIVQGMYYEGYDFIHFCAQSVPVMLVEAVVRMGYAIKKIKEGSSIKDAIPVSCDREQNPKLATMLFIGHSGATAVNAGKVVFKKNPMAINYPQWLAFGKYAFSQAKWVLIDKPELRDAYVMGQINDELQEVYDSVDRSLMRMAGDKAIVM